jgi:hypothetical protein
LGFGDDDPEGEVDEHADACEENDEEGEDASEVKVPAVVVGEAGADSGDHAVLAGAGELAGAWVGDACLGWGCGGDGGAAGWTKTGVGIYLLAALRTEHWRASGKILFCHRRVRGGGDSPLLWVTYELPTIRLERHKAPRSGLNE